MSMFNKQSSWKIKERKRKFKEASQKNSQRKRNYGIDNEGYNKLYTEQRGNCAICGRHQSEFKKRLSIDHNHSTGKVRQLLCSSCNFMLGYSYENPEILRKAAEYIERHKN